MARLIAIECHGARASIETSTDDLMHAVVEHALPLGWSPSTPSADNRPFAFGRGRDGTYAVSIDGEVASRHETLDLGVDGLRHRLLMHVLSTPRDRMYIHAGCVAVKGGAILLPGYAGAGKTTLVAALVQAGAVYYTDDYAPLDADGRVHPYPLPLWMTDPRKGLGRPHPPEELGARIGREPLEVSVVAEVVVGSEKWRVSSCGGSEAVLLLLRHAVNPQHQPEFALAAIRGAVAGARVLKGERGAAKEAATALLELAAANGGVSRR
jgi:hypothetical protein